MHRRLVHLCYGAGAVMGLVVLLGWFRGWGRVDVPADLPTDPGRVAMVQQRLDPNTADAPALACLPGIGEKTAALIVQVRRERQARTGRTVVFQTRDDLLLVRGIGEKTLRRFEAYLLFPTPTTAPAPSSE